MSFSRPLRALVTGGAGFIGSHLSRRLLDLGYQVTTIDNLSTGQLSNLTAFQHHENYRFVIEDIRHEMVMDRLVSECDIIFHLAAAVGVKHIIEHPIETLQTNILGTEIVLKTAARYHKKVMLASTSEVYGKSTQIPFAEDEGSVFGNTTKSRWGYAVSKMLDEFLALAYYHEKNLPVVIFRLFNTVGPGQLGNYGMVIPRFVQWALQGQPIQVFGDGAQTRCFGNVFDVIEAIIDLSRNDKCIGEIFNIGSNEEVTILDLAQRIIAATHSTSTIDIIPYEKVYNVGFEDMLRRVPDITKIRAFIEWEPSTPLESTLQQVIDYYQHQANL